MGDTVGVVCALWQHTVVGDFVVAGMRHRFNTARFYVASGRRWRGCAVQWSYRGVIVSPSYREYRAIDQLVEVGRASCSPVSTVLRLQGLVSTLGIRGVGRVGKRTHYALLVVGTTGFRRAWAPEAVE